MCTRVMCAGIYAVHQMSFHLKQNSLSLSHDSFGFVHSSFA